MFYTKEKKPKTIQVGSATATLHSPGKKQGVFRVLGNNALCLNDTEGELRERASFRQVTAID